MSGIGDVVVELDAELRRLGVDYAIGGGLALQYYANPRFTNYVDVNVAVPFDSAGGLVDELADLGYHPTEPATSWLPIAGVRMARYEDPVFVDLFFAFDEYHRRLMERVVVLPFWNDDAMYHLPFLSADDLAVVKLSFGRVRDWLDLEAMVDAGTPFDVSIIESSLVGWRGNAMYPRIARLRRIVERREDRSPV